MRFVPGALLVTLAVAPYGCSGDDDSGNGSLPTCESFCEDGVDVGCSLFDLDECLADCAEAAANCRTESNTVVRCYQQHGEPTCTAEGNLTSTAAGSDVCSKEENDLFTCMASMSSTFSPECEKVCELQEQGGCAMEPGQGPPCILACGMINPNCTDEANTYMLCMLEQPDICDPAALLACEADFNTWTKCELDSQ